MPTISKTVARYMDNAGVRCRRVGTYTGPASYATGGDALVPGDVNLGTIEHITFENPINGTPLVRLISYDYTNQKAIWFEFGSQVANGTDLSGYSCRFEAVGK